MAPTGTRARVPSIRILYSHTATRPFLRKKKKEKKTVPGLQPPRSKTRNSATQEVTSGRQSIQILSLMGILSGRGRNSANPGGSHASPPHHMPNHSIHTNAGGARYDPKHPYTRPSVGGVVSDVLTRTFHPPPSIIHMYTRTRVRTRCMYTWTYEHCTVVPDVTICAYTVVPPSPISDPTHSKGIL